MKICVRAALLAAILPLFSLLAKGQNPVMKAVGGEVPVEGCTGAPDEALTLWYRAPADNWVTQALPIGNGNMGAMIFGGIAEDHIQFNHKTLWRGSAAPDDLGSYLSFGDIYVTDRNATGATGYRRSLNLRDAVACVEYSSGGTGYRREYFASFPDEVIVIRYTADGIAISGARQVTLFLTCATSFSPAAPRHLAGTEASLAAHTDSVLNHVPAGGYDEVLKRHKADYSALFGRVDFTLAGARNDCPTDSLLLRTGSPSATALADMLIFQYGRYLTIASSRGIDVPSNLQGLWNRDGTATRDAVWASDIHSNINVQMNYWPVESTNLSECHLPFLNYIYNEATRPGGTWQQNARELGAREGWVVNTAGNIFGGSSNYKRGRYSVATATPPT